MQPPAPTGRQAAQLETCKVAMAELEKDGEQSLSVFTL